MREIDNIVFLTIIYTLVLHFIFNNNRLYFPLSTRLYSTYFILHIFLLSKVKIFFTIHFKFVFLNINVILIDNTFHTQTYS